MKIMVVNYNKVLIEKGNEKSFVTFNVLSQCYVNRTRLYFAWKPCWKQRESGEKLMYCLSKITPAAFVSFV